MRKSIALLLTAFFLLPAAPRARADEGMWTFDNPPLKQWKERYNFEPTKEWLDNVRLASVRLNDGGSGSFVSPDGLLMTNQHVASGQLSKVSTKERDYTKNGFYARTAAEELKCPDLEINVLVSFEDVTKRVQGAVKAGATSAQAAEQRKGEMAAIERESNEKTSLRSDVVTLYSGGEYWLYRFKKYTDIRLVFAAEEQIAFFGGDYDNFTFPRYDLDFAFFRVYENDKPLKTANYFRWSKSGPSEGEFVVAPGNPGSTNRMLTLAQLKYQRDVGNPLQMQVWTSRRDALARYAAGGAEQARRAQSARRSLENSIKRLVGQQEGLHNARSFGRKEEDERKLLAEIARRPESRSRYAPAWAQLEAAYKELPAMAKRLAFTTLAPSRLGTIASQLVRYAAETTKPNSERLDEFRENRLESLKLTLLSPAPIYPDLEEAVLAGWLEEARKTLGADDPFVRAALEGSTPAEVAKRVVAGTKLADVAFRKSLVEGGAAAVAKSDDPLVALARRVEPVYRELRAWNEQHILSVETGAGQKIAEARFAVYGKSVYPDATFSLRLSYGRVLGYEEDTTLVPYKTTFYGLYERARSFDEKPPYDLPARWRDGRDKLDLSTPFNFVYTADTIGGNSGSPVINRNAEIVGLNFDSNIQKLPNRYWYVDDPEGGRAVAVHSAAMIEALRKMYDAGKLADELTAR
ncbi:MAG: S46 family peptidase [Acidobacteria bacterium]|nr:S46 family peptidase [Acidobacteriota bacterium]MCA1643614.1 S46 family peptidase [Acidobacteriota bacterium]